MSELMTLSLFVYVLCVVTIAAHDAVWQSGCHGSTKKQTNTAFKVTAKDALIPHHCQKELR